MAHDLRLGAVETEAENGRFETRIGLPEALPWERIVMRLETETGAARLDPVDALRYE